MNNLIQSFLKRWPVHRGINRLLRPLGCGVVKLERHDLFFDLKRFLPARNDLIIFDVGANEGQTQRKFRAEFPRATLHSFEPGTNAFAQLQKNTKINPATSIWNLALGSKIGQQEFFENTLTTMSSFLPLGKEGWGGQEKKINVPVTTIDQFCAERGIERIDILKSDTQGYDLEIFKGAEGMMQKESISLIYFEVIFTEIYRNLPSFDETFHYLADRGFRLEALYDVSRYGRATWTDALFVHEKHLK